MTLKRIILLIIPLAAVLGLVAAVWGLRSIGDNRGYEPDQPIAFSHKIHAGENAISCLYCHFGAEKSRHAGIPPANVCMNCHGNMRKDAPEIAKIALAIRENKPIEWIKVYRMADFAYFNHAEHVAVGNLKCQTCHGPVETMTRMRQEAPVSMGWCIECHRNSDVVVHGATQKVSDNGGLDCAKCHY